MIAVTTFSTHPLDSIGVEYTIRRWNVIDVTRKPRAFTTCVLVGALRTVLVSIDFSGKLANGCHDWNRKLVIIGDGACGKTSLLSVFTLGYFPTVSDGLSSSSV